MSLGHTGRRRGSPSKRGRRMKKRMRAISLWQPYATLIADGFKQYETRDWQPSADKIGGVLAIHAAQRWTKVEKQAVNSLVLRFPVLNRYAVEKLPLGAIVCAVRLVAVYRTEDIRERLNDVERAVGNYGNNRFAWKLQLLKVPDAPIKASGAQAFWFWEYE